MIIQFFSILKHCHSLSLTNIIIYIQQKEGKNSEAYISWHGSETDHFQSHTLEIKQNVQSYLPKKSDRVWECQSNWELKGGNARSGGATEN